MLGIYIHIPFCLKRCGYCDFCSSIADKGKISAYAEAVVRNIESSGCKGEKVDTVYLGGGTPSLLSTQDMAKILFAVRENFSLSEDAEISIEANPGTVSLEKLEAYRSAGVNRISFGVQSCKDDELYSLGRIHTFLQAVEAVRLAEKAGIKNISCDLMIGIPGQTFSSLEESVLKLCELNIAHVSAYMLKIEEGTPFDCEKIRVLVADDDEAADMYLIAAKLLGENGFEQYEISNFSKPGYESRHNLKYWTGEPYIGFGASAHSFFGGKRFFVPEDIDGFISSPLQKTVSEDDSPDLLSEYIMLGLRLVRGISLKRIDALGGSSKSFLRAAELYTRAGLMHIAGDSAFLTLNGFLVSNGIISALIDSQH